MCAILALQNPHHAKRASQARNVRKIQNLKEGLESSVSSLDSDSESKDSQKQNLESSLLDSHSHGYSLDSHHHLFAQKEKGCYPLPALSKPRKSLRCFCCTLLATRWVFLRNRGESLAFSLSSQKC
ncbi:hypothetical protein [uncultured Helicobacter sp.]|uniref:hypothetical protein n=1 Tax=uncultured Helicobacter sp. TaxID=175537 RepID=UPI0037527C9C